MSQTSNPIQPPLNRSPVIKTKFDRIRCVSKCCIKVNDLDDVDNNEIDLDNVDNKEEKVSEIEIKTNETVEINSIS